MPRSGLATLVPLAAMRIVTSEIEEAIFLADRLIILSNRPTKVRTVIEITLPRPREFTMLTSREYLNYKQEALEILHQEAMKAFAGGSQTAVADFLEAYSVIRSTEKTEPKP